MKHAIDHIRKFIAEQTVQLEQKQNAANAHRKSADEAQAEVDAIKATLDELGRVLLELKSRPPPAPPPAPAPNTDKPVTESKQADTQATEKGKARK